jgi:glucose/arabinose dehydrogenase
MLQPAPWHAVLVLGLLSIGHIDGVPAAAAEPKVEVVVRGLEHPWGLAFLPDGRLLVTERPGRMNVLARGSTPVRVAGVPPVVAVNQGGLLDVVLDPKHAENKLIYWSYAERRTEGGAGTTVARARLELNGSEAGLADVRSIFQQQPAHGSALHFGSRIVFARDGSLYVTLGERYVLKDEAQNPSNHIGKIVRIDSEGRPHPENPGLNGKTGWAPEIWSIGHRNVQGAALHPQTGELWTAEHGAKGGDEINVPRKGRNYGWPVISYGRDYSGAKIGIGTFKEGMEQPIYYWDPSIAPSGMTFYTGDLFPAWKGDIFIGALALQHVSRIVLDGERVVKEERLLTKLGSRIRDVRTGPDGALWVLTDDPKDGRVLRLTP